MKCVLTHFRRERKFARQPSIKVLSIALLENGKNCERFMDKQGLKTLFALFMNKTGKKQNKEEEKQSEGL